MIDEPSDPDVLDPDAILTCWCETCGGSGRRDCYCGGDLCVCHLHGGIECDGCEDCDLDEDDFHDD